jgi:hypothetical protein
MLIRCRENPYTEQLSSDGTVIVDVFTGRYLETGVCLSAYCIATGLCATVCCLKLVYLTKFAVVFSLFNVDMF